MEKHSIVLQSGQVISSGSGGASIGSVKLTRTVNSGTELTAGSVCAALLELELMDTGVCPLQAGEEFTLLRDGKQVGIFTVDTPKRVGRARFSITAYDRISRLDQNLEKWLDSLTLWPYPLEEFTKMVCKRCGLEVNGEDLPNGVFPVKKFTSSEVTGRRLIGWAAQIMGMFCTANDGGKLEFSWYTPGDIAISTQNGESCAGYFAGTLTYSDFSVAPVDGVSLPGGIFYPAEGGSNVFTVSGNPYLTGTDADLPVAQRLYEALSGFTYTPASVTVQAGTFDPGQLVQVTDALGKVFTMPVMTAVRTGQKEILSCTGSPNRQGVTAQSLQSLTGKVQALQTEVGSLKSEKWVDLSPAVEALTAQLSFQKGSTDVLQERLARMESIPARTAAESGLHIKKAGTEMEISADEKGLGVTRNGAQIFSVTGSGMSAPKAQIQTLTVGSHSVFADYAEGTGCFYI